MSIKLPGILFFFALLTTGAQATVAPPNDHCSKAHTIRNVSNWCSSARQFTTDGASPSDIEKPGCWPISFPKPDNDVWFKFTAKATTVNVSVIGAVAGKPGGTLQYPQFSIYRGNCSSGMREVTCISDALGQNIVETFASRLTVGETYYIRVGGRNGRTGSFQLCVNNFNPVPSPASDCSTAVVLCDKSSFTVPNVTGAGRNRSELPAGICLTEESSSAWYKWTCDKAGSLTFTIKPVNPGDDIDFALFMLPFGTDDCSMKVPYRCMASGEDVGATFSMWATCSGSTGLRSGAADVVEMAGCQEGNDNFLAPLKMEAGVSYALVVNNYHNTGNGFSISFSGTGTFVGPKAHFVVNKLKIDQGQELWVKNASSFDGGIKRYEYNFGKGASPQSSRSAGPHKIKYSSTGKKSISLTIETNNGCQVTKVRNVTVTDAPPPPPEPEIVKDTTAAEEIPPPAPPYPTPPPAEELTAKAPEKPAEKPSADPVPEPPPPKKMVETTFDIKYRAVIYFPSDSFSLDSEDIEVLAEIVSLMRENPARKALVEGHTNNIPSDDYCDKLAAARADAAIDYLVAQGIDENRLIREIYGKDKVRAKEKKFQNRRIYQRAIIKVLED